MESVDNTYTFIRSIESTDLFLYLALGIFVIFVFRAIPVKLNHVLGLSIAIFLTLYFYWKRRVQQTNEMEAIYIKLKSIYPRPKYFFIDTDIIELIYDIREYYNYNRRGFIDMIYAIDNFLQIVRETEVGALYLHRRIDNLEVQMRIAIERLQSMIFSLPLDRQIDYKLERAIYYLRLFMQRHIDRFTIDLTNRNKRYLDTESGVREIDGPKAYHDDWISQRYNFV